MKQHRRAIAAVVAAMAIGCGWGARVRAEEAEATFRFAPPDGTVKVETAKVTQKVDLGTGRAVDRTSEVEIRYQFATVPSGHTVTETLTSGRSLDGKDESAQMAVSAFRDIPLAYRIDTFGKMQSVSGVERVLGEMQKKLSPETFALVAKTMTPESVLEQSKSEWDAEVADFIGRPAKVGAAWVSVEEFFLPDGTPVKHYAAKKITSAPLVGGKPGLRVAFAYTTNPEELKSFLGPAGATALAGLKPLTGKAKVSGEGQRTVDPATLIWYDGKVRRWVYGTVTMPEAGEVPMTFTQEKTYKAVVTPPKPAEAPKP